MSCSRYWLSAVVIYALIECIRSRSHEVRSISKPGWILTIILVPLIGALMWFMWGRPRAACRNPSRRPARQPRTMTLRSCARSMRSAAPNNAKRN